jgi:hypothetical protein
MRAYLLAIAGGLLVAAGRLPADILPPGSKGVRIVASFENVADYPDYVFYVWSRDLARRQPGTSSVRVGDDGEARLVGNPLARGEAGDVFLFAVPRKLLGEPSQPPKEEWFESKTPGVLKSNPLDVTIRPDIDVIAVHYTYPIDMTDGLKVIRADWVSYTAETVFIERIETDFTTRQPPAATGAGIPEATNRTQWIVGVCLAAACAAAGLLLARHLRRGSRRVPSP